MHELTYQVNILEWEQEYVEAQNKGRSYIPNPFKHIPWDLRSRKDKNKKEANSPPGDDFEEQLLIGYSSPSEGRSSTKQRAFNYQDEIQRRETLGSDNPLIKEIPLVIDVENLRQQLRQEERAPTPIQYQSEEEYHSGSKQGLTPPNEPENNQPPSPSPNLANNPPLNMAFDANAAQALTLALTNLNTMLAGGGRENKSVNYPTFSGRGDEDMDDFISELAKAFTVNRVSDNRKHIVVASCLKGTAANFYDSLAGITG